MCFFFLISSTYNWNCTSKSIKNHGLSRCICWINDGCQIGCKQNMIIWMWNIDSRWPIPGMIVSFGKPLNGWILRALVIFPNISNHGLIIRTLFCYFVSFFSREPVTREFVLLEHLELTFDVLTCSDYQFRFSTYVNYISPRFRKATHV